MNIDMNDILLGVIIGVSTEFCKSMILYVSRIMKDPVYNVKFKTALKLAIKAWWRGFTCDPSITRLEFERYVLKTNHLSDMQGVLLQDDEFLKQLSRVAIKEVLLKDKKLLKKLKDALEKI